MMLTFLFRFILFIAITLLIIFLLSRLPRSWKKTAQTVIKRYEATREKHPDYSDREIFFTVLDERYPQNNPATKYLHTHKEEVKEKLLEDMDSAKGPFSKFNLTTLIYCCLAIERNKILFNQKDGITGLLDEIETYVKEQGFENRI